MYASEQSGAGPLPPRWLKCPRKSEKLIDNKFLAFKTPLSHKFNDQVPMECRFNPKMIFEIMRNHKVKIGLWIDLTNTNRFYDKQEVTKTGALYYKIKCKGRGACPTKEQTKLFVTMCKNFVNKKPLECIAVHCTHGFNRTGFLIASYLVEEFDWQCARALMAFGESRPPGIYKKDYIEEFYARYMESPPNLDNLEIPDWCEGEFDEEGGLKISNERVKISEFMEGVPSVEQVITQPRLKLLQDKIKNHCGWNKSGFPGCQPVSMTQENLRKKLTRPYRVSWKADGTRYMMLIDDDGKVYFVDRDNCIFHATKIDFRHKLDLRKPLVDTILDGEMVIDTVQDTGQKIPRYLVYDAIRVHGRDCMNDNFVLRYERINTDVISPRKGAMVQRDSKRVPLINASEQSFSVRRKDFCDVTPQSVAHFLSDRFIKQLGHEPDGLIFQPIMEPYILGRCDSVLKWKPLSMNSVDFRLKADYETGEGVLTKLIGFLYVSGQPHAFGKLGKTSIKQLRELDGKIIECKYEDYSWIFMRERSDKSFPNGYKTAQGVCESIKNPVTKEMLLEYIDRKGYKIPDSVSMPPPKRPLLEENNHANKRRKLESGRIVSI